MPSSGNAITFSFLEKTDKLIRCGNVKETPFPAATNS